MHWGEVLAAKDYAIRALSPVSHSGIKVVLQVDPFRRVANLCGCSHAPLSKQNNTHARKAEDRKGP